MNRNDQEVAAQRRRYVVHGTVFISIVEIAVFVPMIWSSGLHSGRDVRGLIFLVLWATLCAYVFSLVTWEFLKGWFGG